jgi:gas vesicle protein
MEEKSGFGYFLLGLGIGVAAGVLWAPKSGEETRQLLADKAGEGADYLKARTDEGKQYVAQRASEGKEYLRQQTDTLKGSASELYDKGRTTVAKQKENLSAAVEAGKQAYRDAVSDVKSTAASATSGTSGSPADNL